MRFLAPVLFILALLLAVELSFRVYLYGPSALNPVKMNSFNQIHHSGLVRASAVPEIGYELLPDQDVWYKGTRFRTNSAGLRDREYSLEKPADTFRVVVVGSSWTMGSGVEIEDVWHSQLEERLNAEAGSTRVEIINFGVDQYGLGEIIATLEHKALAYDPDLVVFVVTQFTPTLLWPEEPEPYRAIDRRHPFFDIHALRVLDHRFEFGLFDHTEGMRAQARGEDAHRRQAGRAAERLIALARTMEPPMIIVRIAYMRGWKKGEKPGESVFATLPGIDYADTTERVRSTGYPPSALRISVWDSHPNARAHGLIADAVYQVLSERGLLPPAQ